MNEKLIEHIAPELNSLLKGGILSKIHQPTQKVLIFKVFTGGPTHSLVVSIEPEISRIYLNDEPWVNPPRPLRFCALLRSRLQNARIDDISALPGESIIEIKFAKKDNITDEVFNYTLRCELTGKSANVILIDSSDSSIVDAVKHFKSGVYPRAIEPGLKFTPLESVKSTRRDPPFQLEDFKNWLDAVRNYYSPIVIAKIFGEQKIKLTRIINKRQKFLRKKMSRLVGDKEKAKVNILMEQEGELLKGSLHNIKKGDEFVEVDDYYQSPPTKTKISLDKKLSPQDNITKKFKRSKKAKTTLKMIKPRIEDLQNEINSIEELEASLEAVDNLNDLILIEIELKDLKLLKDIVIEIKESKKEKVSQFREYTFDGFKVLIGKSSKANDDLVRRGKKGDLWLHANDAAGSHGLILSEGKTISIEAIEQTAELCAYYSKSKNQTKAEVMYTDIKNVTKPKGARPGAVMVREFSTILVVPKQS